MRVAVHEAVPEHHFAEHVGHSLHHLRRVLWSLAARYPAHTNPARRNAPGIKLRPVTHAPGGLSEHPFSTTLSCPHRALAGNPCTNSITSTLLVPRSTRGTVTPSENRAPDDKGVTSNSSRWRTKVDLAGRAAGRSYFSRRGSPALGEDSCAARPPATCTPSWRRPDPPVATPWKRPGIGCAQS